ncbi:penicillin-binding protein, partial [Patescibacteria group bacterium]|nr:penicillin-binding protein [Patescibacteria group bacterium]
YDGTFRGEVTLRQALAQSLNIPSVKVLMELAGIEESIATAHAMGIRTLQGEYGPSLVLGAGEVRLLELTSAYGVFAAEGKRVPPLSVLRVETATGEELERNFHEGTLVLDPAVARLVTDILSDNEARTPMFGASSSLSIPGYPEVAAKTGTTQEYRDAWTLGYLPISSPGGNALVAGVWVGNNNNEAMYRAPGVVVAGPIWNAFMTTALGGES